LNPASSQLMVFRLALIIGIVAVATLLLRFRRVTGRLRLAFLVGGVLVLGVGFGLFGPANLDPNPVFALRTVLRTALVPATPVGPPAMQPKLPVAALFGVMLVVGFVSNKGICGWGCQLGLLQDLLHRFRTPKYKPPFWLTNAFRAIAFVALAGGLALAGLDWIGLVDPFRVFRFNYGLHVGGVAALILVASVFVWRPWCQLLCPFGLVSWLTEHVSLLRPRVDRSLCINCRLCVKACPGRAMEGILANQTLRADCFACGACIEACPKPGALDWRGPRAVPTGVRAPAAATAKAGPPSPSEGGGQ